MRPLLATLAVALVAVAGCDTTRDPLACTLIGCSDTLLVRVDGATANGRYRVSASGDVVQACTFRLESCTDGACVSGVAGDGCDGVIAEDGGVTVFLDPVRGQVTVRAERDGATLAQTTLAPVYEPQYPNGRRCGAVCELARVGLTSD